MLTGVMMPTDALGQLIKNGVGATAEMTAVSRLVIIQRLRVIIVFQ